MLNRLEALYLNILRVVIIVLATVMLIGAGIGVVVAAPMLISSFKGETNAAQLVRSDDLAAYRRGETGSSASGASGEDYQDLEERAADADRRFREAAANIARYVRAKSGTNVVQPAVAGYLQDQAYRLPESLADKYAGSVLALTQELVSAPATAGTVDVDQLISWHFGQFEQAANEAAQRNEAQAAEAAERRGTAVLAATFALVLFAIFLLMVFVFVLVKIERNLRQVPVVVNNRSDGVTILATRPADSGV